MARAELIITHRTSLEKYSYFLLAAAGAAIGLAVNQTKDASFSTSQYPLGLAVASWLLSFLFGCLHTENYQLALWYNALLLEVKSGGHPAIGTNLQAMEIALGSTMEHFDRASTKMKRYGLWQFRFLALGALFYLGWHVWGMHLRTVAHGG